MNIFEALRESHDRQRGYADALIQTHGDSEDRVAAYEQLKAEL
ncbi:hemerythrin, partial [Priestia megaterium]